jgi:23S rRNA (uracil747-C5)-methyltransferase
MVRPSGVTSTFCPYFNASSCRSCSWIELEYGEQLLRKERMLADRLAFLAPGAAGGIALEPSVRSAPQGFRNRAKMSVTGTLAHPVVGLVGPVGDGSELDQGRELLSCPIHHPKLNELIAALPDWITRFGLTPYRIQARTGELKAVIAFYSPGSGEAYVRFVLRSRECVPRLRERLLPEIALRFPWVGCVSVNLQPIPHALLEGPEEIVLTERGHIEHELGSGLKLRLAPQAFVQTNAQVATELYETAASWISEASPERVLELFCGQGAFSFFAARKGPRSFLGIEINADAVRAASQTAKDLGLDRSMEFRAMDATHVEGEIQSFTPGLILVNPPRRGLTRAGAEQIARSGARHVIYSSCALDTLALDARVLAGAGYKVRRTQLFDMFPHTEHFETLLWMKRD